MSADNHIDVLERETWCTRWHCTTCGAMPFREAILGALGAADDLDPRSAALLLDSLHKIDSASLERHHDAFAYLLRWVGTILGQEEVISALGVTDAGLLYERMLDARDRADARRAEHSRRNNPESVAAEQSRKAAERALCHEARLAAKRIRDAERRAAVKAPDETS